MSRVHRARALAVLLLALPLFSHAATRACNSATTLEALTDCISLQMPQHASRDYVVPDDIQRTDFRALARQMLEGECNVALPPSLAGPMRMRSFVDSGNGKSYCLLMEVDDADNDGYVDRGWGTFIVYRNATRELSHQAPHPKFSTSSSGDAGDSYTEREAVRIFKQTESRSYLMCGARRSANPQASSCQPDYDVADCAHNTDSMFHAANEALDAFYGARNWTALQWHGMAASSCRETVFMSIGFDKNPPAGSKVLALRDAIRTKRPAWVVNTPDTACSLNATENPQGRMLNGVPSAQSCDTKATAPSQKFMHIEQDVPVIGADLDGVAASWAEAIVAALTPTDGGTEQSLNPAADSYVRDNAKSTNYGGAGELQIKGGGGGGKRIGFLKFDMGATSTIGRAVLRLHIAQSAAGAGLALDVHGIDDMSWAEGTLNWNNKPALGASLATATTTGTTAFLKYEFDVTSYVQAERARGRQWVSFGLSGRTAANHWAKARSREAAANKPKLIITP